MKDKTVYAVVDIETTGTSTEHDKIIQFACVLVQDREIINYFSTDINPLKTIPKNIEILTGMTNKQVANAPYFEDIAPIITDLLEDCVFVAHNVYFDFHFLNSELRRAQEREIHPQCIDTVELAQILLPKSPGFRVADLAEYLDLDHENPHQALSDAYVTAEIFIELLHRVNQVPLLTLNKLTELSVYLGVDNAEVFKKTQARKNKARDLVSLKNIKTINMISLRMKHYQFRDGKEEFKSQYPYTIEEKKELENSEFGYRDSQGKMMDSVYHFAADEKGNKNLLIEASTGSGKSLGYLLPLSHLKKKNEALIVSTSTILLQEQLLDISLPQLETVTGQRLNGMILKSSRHFIDLEKFYKTLLVEPNHQKQYIINQMAVLNWLTQTETGDLDEVNLNKNHLFFEQIEHKGLQTLDPNSLFYQEDFLRYVEEKKIVADVIIINHAFLCEESSRDVPLIPEASFLVVDEAHKLIPTLEDKNLTRISFNKIYGNLRRIRESDDVLKVISSRDYHYLGRTVELLGTFSLDAKENLQWLETFLIERGGLSELKPEIMFEEVEYFEFWPVQMKKNVKELLTVFREMNQLISDCLSETTTLLKKINDKNYFLILAYIDDINNLKSESEKFSDYFSNLGTDATRLVSLEKGQLFLKKIDFKNISIQETSWYPRFKKIIFTSGTLQLDVASNYFEEQIQLPSPEKLLLSENFSYEDKAKLMVITDDRKLDFGDTTRYVDYLAETIISCYRLKESSMLVLFTSHQILRLVYKQLHKIMTNEEVEIYAQGITGTKEKIAKRFIKNNGGIILGANSFWEGVDFNLPNLDIIIMTKLPFDPPKRPIVEAKYRYLEEMGKNPFYDEALPQAGSRLRQGLGRLLRTEQDRGVIVVLDSRLTRANYSQNLLEYLPKQLPVMELSLKEALSEIMLFFTEKNLKD